MAEFNEGKGYKGIGTIKIFEFENTRSETSKNAAISERKRKLDRSFSTYTKSSKKLTFLPPDTETYESISRGEKC